MNPTYDWLSPEQARLSAALKAVARNPRLKEEILKTPALYRLLRLAASRFVAGEDRDAAMSAGRRLLEQGYRISLEYIGENTVSTNQCRQAADEFSSLIEMVPVPCRISLDLSHIGLAVSPALAHEQLGRLASEAARTGKKIFVSMEESAKTDEILTVYKEAAACHRNLGITLQAQLHRTEQDLAELLAVDGEIRIVKGAYEEPAQLVLPRSIALNERYVRLVERAVAAGKHVSAATHDSQLVEQLRKQFGSTIEYELLYGIRGDLGAELLAQGLPVRIYLTYGSEWYLYLCHRLAEYPPNVYEALSVMLEELAQPSGLRYG
ncbi:proline dehydrogenase family protein [Paenibacillus sp. SYP-B4298]|uniref:proline dehydrogenase family protein n=1 Tax=Paenibacillus sp. SYP-B4298 TaxID=2996034 RepID=UPI0022DD0730|nr:proline dehydrogenase family protein [Paenibacillus sp. SYP-B4298]